MLLWNGSVRSWTRRIPISLFDGKALRGAAEKTKSGTAPMLLNVVETGPGIDTCTASGRFKDE